MNTVPTDAPSVFAPLNTLVQAKKQYAIVRPDNPPPGIAGFVFAISNDETVELESDITDHFTEDNNPVQDHIALKPETVTVTGEVAEVVKSPPGAVGTNSVPNPLPDLPGLRPELSPGAQSAFDLGEEDDTVQSAEAAGSLYDFYQERLPQQPDQTKQGVAFGYFYQLWKGRMLCTVETPWGFFTNMAVQSVSSHQGPSTRNTTDFSIVFRKIRTVRSVLINGWQVQAGRASTQWKPLVPNGVAGLLPALPPPSP
ncbi:MAG: hypothetical protein KGJ86_00680 [Chloroflexota bacterium]|nr:hypothetical protein [Chloroflexota bacterium]